MITYIDSSLVHLLMQNENKEKEKLENLLENNLDVKNKFLSLPYNWETLFDCLNIDLHFKDFFCLDKEPALLAAIQSHLISDFDQNRLIDLYDQLFAECLTHVKNLSQINSTFLLTKITEKKVTIKDSTYSYLIMNLLEHYEHLLIGYSAQAMHDCILYLGWDRMCVNVAIIFEAETIDKTKRNALKILEECLIESFIHIKLQGKTVPSYFRLIEALYAFEMREENLQMHSEDDWLLLCKSTLVLQDRNALINDFYLEFRLNQLENQQKNKDKTLCFLTTQSAELITASDQLARYFLKKIKTNYQNWPFYLVFANVMCIDQDIFKLQRIDL